MKVIRRAYELVGSVSEWCGRLVMFLIPVLIVSVTYDVFARYLFNAPTIWSYTLSYMLGSTVIAIGLPYVYYHNSNVRVDIIYSRLSYRARRILDASLTLFVFFPLLFILTRVFARYAWESFVAGEVATESIWYPPFWPFKTVVTLGFVLLLVQGIATFARDVCWLVKGEREPW